MRIEVLGRLGRTNMIAVIDLKETQIDRSDVADLQTLLKQLIGQPFHFFRVSYGDEMRLHLGTLQSYSNPRLRGRMKGSYILSARASSWIVFSAPRRVLATSDDVENSQPDTHGAKLLDIKSLETGNFITPGSLVESARVNRSAHGFTLLLVFSDDSTIFIRPTPESYESVAEGETRSDEHAETEAAETEIADWELLTPHQRILTVGPGLRWSYVDSTSKGSE
jgi:hypothetical protein